MSSRLPGKKLYFLNGWLRKTRDGQPYLSLSIKRKDAPKPKAETYGEDDPF